MPSEHTHALTFRNVNKSFGAAPALKGFSLEVPQGELFGLVGGNGAGKTTLIKCLLDFCETDSGEIEIYGVSHRLTASRANVAFLPERFNPPYYLTGRDFLRYMAELYRVGYDETIVTRASIRKRGRSSSASSICCARTAALFFLPRMRLPTSTRSATAWLYCTAAR